MPLDEKTIHFSTTPSSLELYSPLEIISNKASHICSQINRVPYFSFSQEQRALSSNIQNPLHSHKYNLDLKEKLKNI